MGPDFFAWVGVLLGSGSLVSAVGLFIWIGRTIERFEAMQQGIADFKKEVKASLSRLEENLDEASESNKKGVDGVSDRTREEIRRAHERLDRLSEQVGTCQADVRLLGQGLRDRLSSFERAEAQLSSLVGSLGAVNTSIKGSAKEIDRMESRLTDIGQLLSGVSARVDILERGNNRGT